MIGNSCKSYWRDKNCFVFQNHMIWMNLMKSNIEIRKRGEFALALPESLQFICFPKSYDLTEWFYKLVHFESSFCLLYFQSTKDIFKI